MKALQLCHRCCNVRSSDAAVELLCRPDAVVLRELLGQRLEVGEVASFGPIEDGEHLSGSEVLAGEHGQTVYDREREQQRRVDRQVDLHRIPVLRHNEPGEGDQLSIDGDGPAVVEQPCAQCGHQRADIARWRLGLRRNEGIDVAGRPCDGSEGEEGRATASARPRASGRPKSSRAAASCGSLKPLMT